jgi:hypothetical protein
VIVGTGPHERTFLLHQRLVSKYSDYFAGAFRPNSYAVQFIEASTGEVYWPDDDPAEFHRWVSWLYTCNSCKGRPNFSSDHQCGTLDSPGTAAQEARSWCAAEAEDAFELGDRLISEAYCTFSLSIFIQHVHLMDPTRLAWTLDNVRHESALHRFARGWIAFLKFRNEAKTTWTGKEMADPGWDPVFDKVEGWSSLDPRRYRLHHWMMDCSKQTYVLCQHRRYCGPAPVFVAPYRGPTFRPCRSRGRGRRGWKRTIWYSGICTWVRNKLLRDDTRQADG